jgi:hypothetical protein
VRAPRVESSFDGCRLLARSRRRLLLRRRDGSHDEHVDRNHGSVIAHDLDNHTDDVVATNDSHDAR